MSVLTTTTAEPVAGGWLAMRKLEETRTPSREREALHFRIIYLVSVVVFLAAVTVRRLLHWSKPRRGSSEKSIIGEARAAANTVVPFVFMA
jgi:hypothetical protein